MTEQLAYLATAYSRYPGGIEAAFMDAACLAARLLKIGVKAYSPICHTHPIAMCGNIDPLDHAIWMPFDEAMMRVCDVLIVAHMPSWDGSDLGGDAIQSKALECGIIKEVPYDPDIHGDNDCDVERGESWLVFIDALSPLG